MSVRQVHIIDALKDLVVNRRGTDFQYLATSLAKRRFPDLVASESGGDLGSDAYLFGFVTVEGKRVALAASLTAEYTKIRDDCVTIQDKQGLIDCVLFYTPKSRIRKTVMAWAKKLKSELGVDLEVITQTEIVETLREPDSSWICRDYLGLDFSDDPTLDELRGKLLDASRNSLAGWMREHGRHVLIEALVEPRLEQQAEERQSAEQLSLADLKQLVVARQDCVLLGKPGAGKTILLFQLADTVLKEVDAPIPILVSAASWANSGRTLLEFIASQTVVQAVGLNVIDLARLSQAGSVVFLINGWNEISQSRIEWITAQLREEMRAHPPPSLIVVTRYNGNRPSLTDEVAIEVLELTDESRAEIIKKRVGQERAPKLIEELESVAFLDELTKTPLFLSGAISYHERYGKFPETTFSALEGLVETAERQEPHRTALPRPPIRDQHRRYMAELAYRATDSGEVQLSRKSVREYLFDAAQQLKDEKQISEPPDQEELANALSDHHLLVDVSGADRALRFSHQQVQEWFAALYLWNRFFQAATLWSEAERSVLKSVINKRDWEQPLILLIEHLAHENVQKEKILELAMLTLPLDIIFACEILHFADCSHVAGSDPRIRDVILSCFKSPDDEIRQYGLAAMLASGSEEFSNVLWPLLENEDDQVRLRTYQLWQPFPVSCLGPQWKERIEKWAPERRAEFVWSVFMHDSDNVHFAKEFAEADPEPAVRVAGISALHWLGRMKELEGALVKSDEGTILALVEKGELGYLPTSIKRRLVPEIKDLLRREPNSRARAQILGVLMDVEDADCFAWIKEDLEKENVADWPRRVVEYANQVDPRWFASWMSSKIVAGTHFHSSWLKFLSSASDEDREKVIRHALELPSSAPNPYRFAFVGTLCRLPNIERILAEYFAYVARHVSGERLADGENERMRMLFAIACKADPNLLVDCILKNYLSPASDRIRVHVLRLLTQEREREGEDRSQRSGVKKSQLQADNLKLFQQMLREWCDAAINHDDPDGSFLAELASAIADLGEASDVDLFFRLIDRDVKRIEAAEAKRQEWVANGMGGPNPVPIHYAPQFLRAALSYEGKTEFLLLRLLQTTGFEGLAAGGLVRLSTGTEERERRFGRSFDAKAAVKARESRRISKDPHKTDALREHYRSLIRDRLAKLLDAFKARGGSPSTSIIGGDILGLLGPFSALANEKDLELVGHVLGLSSKNQWARVDALELLVQRGLVVPLDMALPLLRPVVEEVAAMRWADEQTRSLVRRTLCVLLLCDKSVGAVDFVKKHVALIGSAYALREFITTLGAVGNEAADTLLLELLVNESAAKSCTREIFEAMGWSAGDSVKKQLLDWFESPQKFISTVGSEQRDALESYSAACAAIATRDTSFKKALFAYCEKQLDGNQRGMLAAILLELGTEEAAYHGCFLILDDARSPIPGTLDRLLDKIFTEHKPTDENGSSYHVIQRASNRIRERLFEMATSDERRKKTALRLLISNENRRIQLGRPREEPRHPALFSKYPWPLPGMQAA